MCFTLREDKYSNWAGFLLGIVNFAGHSEAKINRRESENLSSHWL